MTIKLEEVVATTNENQDVLGHLFWYSIGQQMNSSEDLEQKLVDSGLGKIWMPNPIRSVDAFRRATREVQKKKPTATAGIYENFLIREVYSDAEVVQRNVVVEQVDQENKKLGYETQTGIMRLDKKNGTLSFETNDLEVRELCREAEQKFYLYRDHYSSQHMRVMVTKVLNSLAPTPMRPNGVIYFIPFVMSQGLTNLVTFIRSLDNSEAFKVPVVNSEDNKDMVSKKLEDHIDQLFNQIQNTEDLKKGQVKALIEETNAAINDYKNYKSIVTSEQEKFEEKIMLLRSEVLKVLQE